jgi:hypothetical protein
VRKRRFSEGKLWTSWCLRNIVKELKQFWVLLETTWDAVVIGRVLASVIKRIFFQFAFSLVFFDKDYMVTPYENRLKRPNWMKWTN